MFSIRALFSLVISACFMMSLTGAEVLGTDSRETQKLRNVRTKTVVPGEYLLTIRQGTGPSPVREAFAEYGVTVLREVSPELILIRLSRDPGLADLKEKGVSLLWFIDVQHNYIYRSFMKNRNKKESKAIK